MEDLIITDAAAKRIAFLLDKRQDQNIKFRIGIDGGGCSGFQYNFDFTEDPLKEDDIFLNYKGARILIDAISFKLIKGAIIDFVENLDGFHFKISNPNATAGCGCGNSFSV